MSDISFPSFPANWRLPLFWAELDPSQAGFGQPNPPALLTGQALLVGKATSTLKAGATGNGTMTLDPAHPVWRSALLGAYKAVFTSATSFNVSGPGNALLGTGALGARFSNQIAFTIAAGSTAFAAGDEFDVTVVSAPQGSAVPGVVVAVGSTELAHKLFGYGSMLARMCEVFFKINPVGLVYALPLAEPAAGQPATATITATAPPMDVGVYSLYGAAQRVQVAVTSTDTTATIAAALASAINAAIGLPFTAAVDANNANQVNLTCRWKGATGNDISLVSNFGGSLAGEVMPTGMGIVLSAFANGAGAPDMTAGIASLGEEIYDYVGMPYTDSASLQAWDQEYGFGPSGRWGWFRELYGSVFSARRDTYSNLIDWGPQGNSGVESIMTVETTSPSPVWDWTAAYAAQAARALLEDPGRPLQSLELTGILPAPRQDRFTKGEANAMSGVGLAVQQIGPNGYPLIAAEYTRWQVNAYGQPDGAYSLVTTLHTLAYLLRRFRSAITSKYPRHKLASDGTKFATGQAIVTPKVLKAEIISEYRQAEYIGLVENTKLFIDNLIVERDSQNPNRVNVLWPPDLINQLRVFAVVAQFRLQYPDPLAIAAQ